MLAFVLTTTITIRVTVYRPQPVKRVPIPKAGKPGEWVADGGSAGDGSDPEQWRASATRTTGIGVGRLGRLDAGTQQPVRPVATDPATRARRRCRGRAEAVILEDAESKRENPMNIAGLGLHNIDRYVGHELGVSSWSTLDQACIAEFAHCTGDDQWIHVDVERAARESPYRSTIAHGYLSARTKTSVFQNWDPANSSRLMSECLYFAIAD